MHHGGFFRHLLNYSTFRILSRIGAIQIHLTHHQHRIFNDRFLLVHMTNLSEYRNGGREEEILFTLDLNGNFIFINRAGEIVSGYSREEALRMNVAELLPSESMGMILEQLRSALTEPFGMVYELEILTKNGMRVVLETSAKVVFRDKTPAIEGIALVTHRSSNHPLRCLDPQFDFGLFR